MEAAYRLAGGRAKGDHYGLLTAKMVKVLWVLLYRFHGRLGVCFPSYDAIKLAADCSRDTVWRAIEALEDVGLLTWDNRYKLVDEHSEADLLGLVSTRLRAVRTSNTYRFNDPGARKSDARTGTPKNVSKGDSKIPDSKIALWRALNETEKKWRSEQQVANLVPQGGAS